MNAVCNGKGPSCRQEILGEIDVCNSSPTNCSYNHRYEKITGSSTCLDKTTCMPLQAELLKRQDRMNPEKLRETYMAVSEPIDFTSVTLTNTQKDRISSIIMMGASNTDELKKIGIDFTGSGRILIDPNTLDKAVKNGDLSKYFAKKDYKDVTYEQWRNMRQGELDDMRNRLDELSQTGSSTAKTVEKLTLEVKLKRKKEFLVTQHLSKDLRKIPQKRFPKIMRGLLKIGRR